MGTIFHHFLPFCWHPSSMPARCMCTLACPGYKSKHFSPKSPLYCRLLLLTPIWCLSQRRFTHPCQTEAWPRDFFGIKKCEFLDRSCKSQRVAHQIPFPALESTDPPQTAPLSTWVPEGPWCSEPHDGNVAWVRNKLYSFKPLGAFLLLQYNLAYCYSPPHPPWNAVQPPYANAGGR